MPLLLQTTDPGTSAALNLPTPAAPMLPAIVDFSGGAAMLRKQRVDGWSDLSGEERDGIYARVEWMKAVWTASQEMNGRGSLDAAVAQVRLDRPAVGRELASAGKCGADARIVKNWRNWCDKIGRRQTGEPRWDHWQALAPRYGMQVREVSPETEAFFRDVCKLWLRPEAPPLKGCVRDVATVWRGNGHSQEDLPTVRQIATLVKNRLPLSVQERYRGGARVYNARSRGYVARQCNLAPGEAVFSDHRISDFWVRIPHPENPEQWIARRPWSTAITDATTGYILSIRLYLTSPNNERIAETLQGAILSCGSVPPRIFYTDCGADFLMQGLCLPASLRTHDGKPLCDGDGVQYGYSVLKSLHCEHWKSAPYNGKEKPVERHFGSISGDFDRTMPGYCGRSPQYRPDPKETYDGDVRLLCTQEQATQRLDAWVRTVHHQVRLADGRTRAEAWAARPARAEAVLDARTLFFALLVPQPEARIVRRTSVGLCGIHVDGWMYSHIELRAWQDKPVLVKTYWGIPPVDRKGRQVPAGVFVFTPDDRFLCAAPADPIGDMFADTDDAKKAIGDIQHLINAAAQADRTDYQEATGLQRLPASRDRAMALIGAGGGSSSRPQDIVQISEGFGNHRRLPAASPSAPPAEPTPQILTSRADAALLERLLGGHDTESASPADTPRHSAADFALLADINLGGFGS